MRERVGVVEVLRRLNESDPRVFEVPEEAVQDVGQWHVIGVQLQDELPVGDAEGVIQVPSLGVLVALSADVGDPQGLGHRLHLFALAIVEHEGAVRISDRPGADCGATQNLERLVEVGDKDVDRQTFGRWG